MGDLLDRRVLPVHPGFGFGAAAIVGPETIANAPGGQNSAAPLLAYELGGTILLGVIAAVAFATILAVVAGLTITASASFAHDIYGQVIKKGKLDTKGEMRAGRATVVVVGVLAILGGIGAQGQNVAFLVALAFAVAASANLPTILYSLFWRRFTTRGALWSMYGGLLSSGSVDRVLPGHVGRRDLVLPRRGSGVLSADQPGHRVDPTVIPAGLVGLHHLEDSRGSCHAGRDGSPLTHRRGC